MKDNDEVLMISFSGGRSSAFMTNELLKEYPNAIVCFANTGKENDATLDFVDECDQLWGGKVVWLEYSPTNKFEIVNYYTAHRTDDDSKPSPFELLIKKRKYVPNIMARFCTQELKILTIKRYMVSLGHKHWTNVVGIRYDEPRRWAKIKDVATRERWETWLPMVDWKTTKADVLDFWRAMPFDLRLNEPNGNCDLCFLKGKAKKSRIAHADPSKADWWIRMEKETGATFNKAYSYADLLKQTVFAYDDPDIECFCNID